MKTIENHHQSWSEKLPRELWAYKITWKNTTRFSAYKIVYGKSLSFLVEFKIRTLSKTLEVALDLSEAHKHWLGKLNELD